MATKTKTVMEPDIREVKLIDTATIRVPVVSVSPLIMHAWSAKAKLMMLDNKQGRKNPKETCDPEAEYEDSFYRFDNDRYGMPTLAFKKATVEAARYFRRSLSMVALRQFIFIRGEYSKMAQQALVEIVGTPAMREDAVRVMGGGADLRYRPVFVEWSATLTVTYVQSSISAESVIALVDAGGLGVGIGDWRPEKKGEFGQYHVDLDHVAMVV